MAPGYGTITIAGRKGSNVNACDNDGNMPIHLAAQEGQTEAITFHHSNGTDANAFNSDERLTFSMA